MKALNEVAGKDPYDLLFDNMKSLLRPKDVSHLLGFSEKTIYDWKYRAKKKRVPDGLFIKLHGKLFLRTDVLKDWLASEHS
jgi:hypothetical protein